MKRFWNDPKTLAKLGEKLGDVVPPPGAVPPPPGAAAGAAAGAPRPPITAQALPDVDNLWDAAKYGDLEAVEDFLAIGKDVSMADEEKRTPLHCERRPRDDARGEKKGGGGLVG